MILNIEKIRLHKQLTAMSCVPMSVECVLKLLSLMPQTDFSLQEDPTTSGNSDWVYPSFDYPRQKGEIRFTRQFLLSDIGLPDRGQHFLDKYFDDLFGIIDDELQNNRFVIVSLQSAPTPTQWHNEVIFDKVSDGIYKTVTFYYNQDGPTEWPNQKIKDRVRQMQGTDILTYRMMNGCISNFRYCQKY